MYLEAGANEEPYAGPAASGPVV